jgi:hypothetical protein
MAPWGVIKDSMKTSKDYQEQYRDKQFYNDRIPSGISEKVKLHDEVNNPLSSAAACLNILGYLNQHRQEIIPFFGTFGLDIEEVPEFPSGADVQGEVYDDGGPIVFEWIGPKESPIHEKGGSRGQNRTSVDAFLIARVKGKYAQLLIEWKFTESYQSGKALHNFGGKKGIERLRRYASVLTNQRKGQFPFRFSDEDGLGLQDFSYEPFYQLLRMTLLAKETTPMTLGNIRVEDYYILHLAHSENTGLLEVRKPHLKYCPGLQNTAETDLHKLWASLLTDEEKAHFYCGYWNKALEQLHDKTGYLKERYG